MVKLMSLEVVLSEITSRLDFCLKIFLYRLEVVLSEITSRHK